MRAMSWSLNNRLFFAVIFLSGFAALIYQLIWVRLLGLVFGVSSFAVATVVAVFLLGLGLGSYVFGKWSEKSANPLKLYCFLEISIAALSLLTYLIIQHLPVFKLAYEYSYNHLDFYGISLVRLLLSLIVLFPPVFAIGGTMPLISKYFITTPETFGSKFSRIYYMNTLGAFSGALLTGFVFVQHLGVPLTLGLAIGLNLLISLVILTNREPARKIVETPGKEAPYSYMLPILFLTGLISISYEILWSRILSTYSLATSQAFSLIVSGFLLGFSIGSYFVSKNIDTSRKPFVSFFSISVLTALSGALVLFIFQRFETIKFALADLLQVHEFSASLYMAFFVSLIPAIFMGMLFPLGLKIYSHGIDEIGLKTGSVFFANTLGCVLGSLVTGFVLIPFVGMWNTTLILVNLSLAISLFMLVKSRKLRLRYLAIFAIVLIAANMMVFTDQKTFHKNINGFDVIYYTEGLSGTITGLERNGMRALFVDGQHVSGTDRVLTTDSKLLAHLPLLIADEPQQSLTVGYGTGATSNSMLMHNIDVNAVEIEEGVINAGYLFGKVNDHSYNNPRLDIVLDDARSYIDSVNDEFDVIVTDVTNLKYKRNPYLYTREYFEIMDQAMQEDGVAAAWLPIAGLSFEDLRILIGTFDAVFPHTTVWYFSQYPTHFIIVIGTPEELRINLDQLAEKIVGQVKKDLKLLQVDDQYEIASMLLLGEDDVDKLVAGAELHTDNYPILEFSDMNLYMKTDLKSNLSKLLVYKREDQSRYFTGDEVAMEKLELSLQNYDRLYRTYAQEGRE